MSRGGPFRVCAQPEPMTPDLSDVLATVGLLLMAAGAGWIYPPAGLIVPGVVLFLMGIRLGASGSPRGEE